MNKLNKNILTILLLFLCIINIGCNNNKQEEHKLKIEEIIITIPQDFTKNENIFISNDNLNKIEIEKINDENTKIEDTKQKIKDEYKNKNIELTEIIIKKDIPKISGLVGIEKDNTIHIYFIENENNKIKMTCHGNNDNSALLFRSIAKNIIVKQN